MFETDFEQRASAREPIEKRSEELVQLFIDALRGGWAEWRE